jgi:uncharacterized protein YndB with AHSA1/START domain
MQGNAITAEKLVHARADAVFSLLSDPSQHPSFDGSGTVRKTKPGNPQRLVLGSSFEMSMKVGVGYSMVSTVIEYDENRLIAWQSRPPGFMGKLTGGRIWRYELEPRDNGTLVRESWDISRDHQRLLMKLGGLPEKTRANMARTLERIEELASPKAS